MESTNTVYQITRININFLGIIINTMSKKICTKSTYLLAPKNVLLM